METMHVIMNGGTFLWAVTVSGERGRRPTSPPPTAWQTYGCPIRNSAK